VRGKGEKQTTPMPFEQSQKLALQGEEEHEKEKSGPIEKPAEKPAEKAADKPVEKPAEPPTEPPPDPDVVSVAAKPSIAMRALATVLVLAIAFAIFATISWLARAI
jgi:hypothetical protein